MKSSRLGKVIQTIKCVKGANAIQTKSKRDVSALIYAALLLDAFMSFQVLSTF